MKSILKPKKDISSEETGVSFLFHLVTIIITCTILFILIKIAINQPEPLEERFLIQSLTPEKMSESSSTPIMVKTGFVLTDFHEFNILADTFVCEGKLWFEFDPLLISLDTISNFGFKNAELKYVSKPRTRMIGSRHILAEYDITVRFSSQLNYRFFPIDDHIISLILVNKSISPHEALFVSDKRLLTIKAQTESYGWRMFFHEVDTGYIEDILDPLDKRTQIENTAARFSVFYVRAGLKYTFILILPMFIFILVMLTSFSYDPNKYFSSIMVANGASLSGLIAYRFIIENMSPKVGYFMLSDYFFLIFLLIAAILFLISIFSIQLSLITKKMLIILVHIVLITVFMGIIWYILNFSFYPVDI